MSQDPTSPSPGWLWVFYGLGGRLDRLRFFIATFVIGSFYYATVSIILSRYFDATYFQLYEYPRVALFVYLFIAWPYYATASKRIADTGGDPRSAWVFVVIVLLPYVGPFFQILIWFSLVTRPGIAGPKELEITPLPSETIEKEPARSLECHHCGTEIEVFAATGTQVNCPECRRPI